MNLGTTDSKSLLKWMLIDIIILKFLKIDEAYTFEIFQNDSDWTNYDFSKLPVGEGSLDNAAYYKFVYRNIRSLPLEYWNSRDKKSNNLDCGGLRSIYQIRFSNIYWQILNHSNGTFYLLNSYYDNRTLSGRPTIRIIGTVERVNWNYNITCQLWFNDSPKPIFAPVAEYKYIWRKDWGYQSKNLQQPYLMSCDIPETMWSKIPVAVSLVENKCDNATNLMKIHNRKPVLGEKKDFAVCVKGLSYEYNDLSVTLIEWLEYLFEMGVSKVIIYVLNVHPNMWKVLEYYSNLGRVELRKHTLSGHAPNIPGLQHKFLFDNYNWKRLQELITYNDCYYDNFNLYKFISLLDLDELIVPKGNFTTWNQLYVFLQSTLKNSSKVFDGYGFRSVRFLYRNTYENIAPYLIFANTIVRESRHLKVQNNTKSWFSTESILTVHNHYSFNFLSPDRKNRYMKWYEVDPIVAQTQHYSFNRKWDFSNSTTMDRTLWKYNSTVTRKSLKVLQDLGFITRKKT